MSKQGKQIYSESSGCTICWAEQSRQHTSYTLLYHAFKDMTNYDRNECKHNLILTLCVITCTWTYTI